MKDGERGGGRGREGEGQGRRKGQGGGGRARPQLKMRWGPNMTAGRQPPPQPQGPCLLSLLPAKMSVSASRLKSKWAARTLEGVQPFLLPASWCPLHMLIRRGRGPPGTHDLEGRLAGTAPLKTKE